MQINIGDEELERLRKLLNNTISELLYGGNGDACWDGLQGAAICFKMLKIFNLEIKNEKNIVSILEGNNIFGKSFFVI